MGRTPIILDTKKKYGFLKPIRRVENHPKSNRSQWLCFCTACKKECIKTAHHVARGLIKSCSCMQSKYNRGPNVNKRALDMLELYKGKYTLEEIGEKYDISRERVRQLLSREARRLGISLLGYRKKKKQKSNRVIPVEMLELYEEKRLTVADIAYELQWKKSTTTHILNRMGVKQKKVLKPNSRIETAYTLYKEDELPLKEIAMLLDTSVGNVNQMIHRARLLDPELVYRYPARTQNQIAARKRLLEGSHS